MRPTSDKREPIAMIVCGALVDLVHEIARRRGWRVDLHGVPARHHLYPDRIVEAVDRHLGVLGPRYRSVVVVYGDCGTAGALDRVLARHGAVRSRGPHCYAMLAGCKMKCLEARVPETYLLTDYLVRHWRTAVLEGLGLDRRPELVGRCFAGFERLLYLRQKREKALEAEARRIATSLGLPLDILDVGLAGLESCLAEAVEGR